MKSSSSSNLSPYVRRVALENSRSMGGHLLSFLARGADTGGQFTLMEIVSLAGKEAPAHRHTREDEAAYVLEGEIECRVGGETVLAREGDFVLIPRAEEHGLRVAGSSARLLLIEAPSGLEEALSDAARSVKLVGLGPVGSPFESGFIRTSLEGKGMRFSHPDSPLEAAQPNPYLAVRPALGRSRWHCGQLITTLAGGYATHGRLAVVETWARRGQECPPHCHDREDEGVYFLEGAGTFWVGGRACPVRQGDFIFLPRRLPHGFVAATDQFRTLHFFTPAGVEHFYEEHSQPARGLETLPVQPCSMDAEAIARIGAKYGLRLEGADGVSPSAKRQA